MGSEMCIRDSPATYLPSPSEIGICSFLGFTPHYARSQDAHHGAPLCPTLTHFPPQTPHSEQLSSHKKKNTQVNGHNPRGAITRQCPPLTATPPTTTPSITYRHTRRNPLRTSFNRQNGRIKPTGGAKWGMWGEVGIKNRPPEETGRAKGKLEATDDPQTVDGSSPPG